MSKSRLEKFLYALYSLDSSDLPNPLSRIEELYKCLVTGDEAPTFEPLSRVEKYLMAILGAYDADSLPNPLSRVDVLLYKLATCDDNLDDVESFLSEHEELLAEIIRNGGVGGNIDIEYVLYTLSTEFNTLYNTAKKPVKSAILKGNTLVNSWKKHNTFLPGDFTFHDDGFMELNNPALYFDHIQTDSSLLKPNTKYLLIIEAKNNTIPVEICFQPDSRSVFSGAERTTLFAPKENGVRKAILTSNSDFSTTTNDLRWGVYIYFSQANMSENERGTISVRQMLIEYQEGMENWDIPYFEGMQSVKMPVLKVTGKNFFDGKLEKGIILANNGLPVSNDNYVRTVNFIKVQPNMVYTISEKNDSTNFKVYEYDENFNYLGELSTETFTTKSNTSHIKFRTYPKNTGDDVSRLDFEIMLETGNTVTPYEPFKSNILTLNEPVELRGIGDVKDELNLLTGELIQRIGVITFDGSENWITSTNQERTAYILPHKGVAKVFRQPISDKWFCSVNSSATFDTFFYVGASYFNYITNQEVNLANFKAQLSDNPVSVQYFLATESVKTVDLSVADQNGNNTELSTFNDITHVTLSSEGLIPEAGLEVATKNEEVLNTMSLEMDDISTTQTTLEETSNAQGENVDATMIATTEIYEQLL